MQKNFTNTSLNHFHLYLLEVLKDLRNKIPDEFRNIVSFPPPIISRPVLNKFGWWVFPQNTAEFNFPKLRLFWLLSKDHEFIASPYDEFEIHFIYPEKLPNGKIIWCGDVMILVLLFYNMIYIKKVIPHTNNFYELLCENFNYLDRKSNTVKPLKHGSLKSSLNKAKRNNEVQSVVNNFLLLLLS